MERRYYLFIYFRTITLIMNRMHQIPGRDTDIRERKKNITQQGWKNFIADLFHDEREQSTLHRTIKSQEILQYAMKTTLDKLERNNAAWPDGIVMKILGVWDDFGNKIFVFLLIALSVRGLVDQIFPQFPAHSIA